MLCQAPESCRGGGGKNGRVGGKHERILPDNGCCLGCFLTCCLSETGARLAPCTVPGSGLAVEHYVKN